MVPLIIELEVRRSTQQTKKDNNGDLTTTTTTTTTIIIIITTWKRKEPTWVPNSGVDGIALLKQKLDQKRCHEPGAADHARSLLSDMLGGHGVRYSVLPLPLRL